MSAIEKKPPSQEVFNKSKAAMLYGRDYVLINGSLSRKEADKFIYEMIKDQIHTGYFRDKRVERAGKEIAERLGDECLKYPKPKVTWKLLSSKPIKEESNLFNDLIVKNFQKDSSSLLCQTYRSSKKDLLNGKFDREYNQFFMRYFNVDFSKYPKDLKKEDFEKLYMQGLLDIYDKYDVFKLKGKELKSFQSILSSTCPEATKAWNYYANEGDSKRVKSPKDSNSNNKTTDKSFDEKHKICLKAADYKGCMNYQNR